VDAQVLKNETAIVGGGDIDKLLEVKTRDIVDVSNAQVDDITQTVAAPATSQ
jgi:prolyl-tRNA editing enzyme YbaK/EbsC (Cys-tRNA(Pro) deacylase)